jgi:hypothetical protein
MLAPLMPPGVPPEMTLVWFGVIVAMNLQTSFLTPPFGFALFYLRSVAAKADYKDRITGATIPAVTTPQIYKGSIAFIVLQLIMVVVVATVPTLVTGGIEEAEKVDVDKAFEQFRTEPRGADSGAEGASAPESKDDPMKGLLESMQRDQPKK